MNAAPRPTPRPRRGAGGFTLMELLVATTVTLVLVVVLVRVFDGASGSWRHSEAQVDAYREARGALQLMARDLSATLQASYAQAGGGADPTPTGGAPAVNPAMPTLALRHYPGGPNDDAGFPNGPTNEEIYCLTNLSPNQGGNRGASSLCAVGYFCQWMADPKMFPVNNGVDQRPRAYALMRQSLDSNGTYQRMKSAANKPRLGFLDLYARNLYSTPLNATPPVAVAAPIAAYVWDVRFRIDTDLDDSTVRDASDPLSDAAYDRSSPVRHYYGDEANPHPPRLPPYVEVRFKALSSLAGRRLEGPNTGVSPATWNNPDDTLYKQFIRPNYQQFVLRVPLLNATPLP